MARSAEGLALYAWPTWAWAQHKVPAWDLKELKVCSLHMLEVNKCCYTLKFNGHCFSGLSGRLVLRLFLMCCSVFVGPGVGRTENSLVYPGLAWNSFIVEQSSFCLSCVTC